eukprot:7629-Heterococcus_DN1.PRE.1
MKLHTTELVVYSFTSICCCFVVAFSFAQSVVCLSLTAVMLVFEALDQHDCSTASLSTDKLSVVDSQQNPPGLKRCYTPIQWFVMLCYTIHHRICAFTAVVVDAVPESNQMAVQLV